MDTAIHVMLDNFPAPSSGFEAGLKCLGRKLIEEGRLLYRGRVGIYVGRPCNSAPACSRLA
jgi:hypothetical protein